jgi:hypothetical protein
MWSGGSLPPKFEERHPRLIGGGGGGLKGPFQRDAIDTWLLGGGSGGAAEDQTSAARRSRTRLTVTADHGAPVGVLMLQSTTARSFSTRAISRSGLPASSANAGANAFACSSASSRFFRYRAFRRA